MLHGEREEGGGEAKSVGEKESYKEESFSF
jgi:hypothetical protein